MAPTRVLIIGCGIAGPVLATLLKHKGYAPAIYERQPQHAPGGISLLLQPNGLRVLALIPGLLAQLPGRAADRFALLSAVPGDEGALATSGVPAALRAQAGAHGLVGVGRAAFHQLLIDTAGAAGVPIHWGHRLAALEQGAAGVTAVFADGARAEGSFVVGCDGLHSAARVALFGAERADFTGLAQTGGISPTPASFTVPSITNIFGVDCHFISYPVSSTHTSWAISQREGEYRETWGPVDEEHKEAVRTGPFSTWDYGAGELVRTAETVVRYGLYDRPELKTWYKGRVVLLGDAAHPTSPHLGQGANQAFEDAYHLVRALVKHNPDAGAPSTNVLEAAFGEYERVRLPRSAQLVKGARRMGETRVVAGLAQCKMRNNVLRQLWADPAAALQNYAQAVRGPFEGASEI